MVRINKEYLKMRNINKSLTYIAALFLLSFISFSAEAQIEPGHAVISCIPGDDDVVLAIIDIESMLLLLLFLALHNPIREV